MGKAWKLRANAAVNQRQANEAGGSEGESGAARLRSAWSAAGESAGVEAIPLESLQPVRAAGVFRGLPPALPRRLPGILDGGE